MKGFLDFCKARRMICILIFLVSLFATIILFRSATNMDSHFLMEDDSVRGIRSESAENGVTLFVKGTQAGVSVEREVIVKTKGDTGEGETKEYKLNPEDEINIEITRVLRELNSSKDDTVTLPSKVGDTLTLDWRRSDSKYSWMLPLLFPPLLLMFMYRGERDEIKQKEKSEAEAIVNELPSFNNKLVLLLGSGLVYEEALRRISVRNQEEVTSVLPVKLGEIVSEAEGTNGDATKLLNEYARKKKISELKRMTNIIMDNQKKGTDLRSKLSLEGELLWDKRKKRAEEQGRISESKLTLPLGIMLIALLIVTAGPALMQI